MLKIRAFEEDDLKLLDKWLHKEYVKNGLKYLTFVQQMIGCMKWKIEIVNLNGLVILLCCMRTNRP